MMQRIEKPVVRVVVAAVLMSIAACGQVNDETVSKISEALPEKPTVKVDEPRKILLYHKPSGFKHKCIPIYNKMFEMMGEKTGAYTVTLTDKAEDFTADNLKQYDALLFNNTTKLQKAFTTDEQRKLVLDYIRNGGGFVAIHSATDAGFPEWPEYTELVGGVFNGHPWNAGGTWGIKVEDCDHPVCNAFGGKDFMLKDELYKYKEYKRENQRVLLTIDTKVSPKGKGQRPDNDHALAWVRDYGKGKVFVSALGHNNDLAWNPQILSFWLDGIQFALGDLKGETKALPQPEWQKQ